MSALFADLAEAAGATVDAVYSEAFTLVPMAPPAPPAGRRKDVNADLVASTARTPVPFVGTWVAPGDLMNPHGRLKADSTTHWVAGAKAMIDAPASAFATRPADGDRVTRAAPAAVLAVAKCLDGEVGRLKIFVTDAQIRPETPR